MPKPHKPCQLNPDTDFSRLSQNLARLNDAVTLNVDNLPNSADTQGNPIDTGGGENAHDGIISANETMLLYSLVDGWIREKEMEGCRKTTLKDFRNVGRQYCRWVSGDQAGFRAQHRDFNLPMLQNYVMDMRNRKPALNQNTIRGYITILQLLGKWLCENGWIQENYADRLKKPPRAPQHRRQTNDAEVLKMLKACDLITSPRGMPPGRYAARARAIISLLAFGGLRSMELRNLLLSDVRLQEYKVMIRNGKGGKLRNVYLPDVALDALRPWMRLRGGYDTPELFLSAGSRVMGEHTYYSIWDQVKELAGLGDCKDLTPHCFRHRMAKRLEERNIGIRDIGNMLGHSQITTTQVYLNSSDERLREIRDYAVIVEPEKKEVKRARKAEKHRPTRVRVDLTRAVR